MKGDNSMAIKTRDEILEGIKNRIGNQTDDETIEFLEDITDTLDDLEIKAQGDGTDWKTKYEENDKEWREKYTERFFSSDDDNTKPPKPNDEAPKPTTFAELFTTA